MIEDNNTPEEYDKLYETSNISFERYGGYTDVDRAYLDYIIDNFDKNISIIDLGCGTGDICGYLNEKGYNAIGVDFSKEALSQAREKYPNVEYIKADMRDLHTYPDEVFDLVLSIGSHEHIYKTDFSECYRLLKKNGTFICVLPCEDRDIGWSRTGHQYEWLLTKDTWKKKLSEFGFTILDIYLHKWIILCRKD